MKRSLITVLSLLLIVWCVNLYPSKALCQAKSVGHQSATKVKVVTYKKFEIAANKSFFHSFPNDESIKKSYLIMGDHIVPLKKANGFYYIEFHNSNGGVSKGWISKNDVMEVDSTTQEDNVVAPSTPTPTSTVQKGVKNLSFENLLDLLNDPAHSSERILSIAKRQNSNWQLKGTDPESSEIMFTTDNSNTREFLSWHSRELILEYLTMNRSQYMYLIKEIKWTGFTSNGKTSKDDIVTATYSDSNTVIQVSEILLSDRKSYGYKFYLGLKR